MRLESTGREEDDQASNLVFWCPYDLPDNVEISRDFVPVCEPGLAIILLAAGLINTDQQNQQQIIDYSIEEIQAL